jgi:hypothetical protein
MNIYFLVSSAFRIAQQTLIYKLDPTLSPGHGAKTVASREVDGAKAVEKAKPSPSTNGKGGGSTNGARPAAAAASSAGPAPARIANRPANKKKKRR